jgi:ATP-dependent protease ClpP protease subunit
MNDVRHIEITEGIGSWGNGSLRAVRDATKGLKAGKIRMVINSFGGSVLEGVVIHNFLKGHPAEVEVHIPGYAMSAATIIASAGDKVTMADTGYYMIHNPWTVAIGDQHEMEGSRNLLQMFADDMAAIYSRRTGKSVDEIKQMMDAETWLTAQEALAQGFVDELTEGAKFEASLPQEVIASYTNVPQALLPIHKEAPKMAEKTIWEKIGAILAGGGTVAEPQNQVTDNEAALMRAVETATADAEASRTALATLQAAYDEVVSNRDNEIAVLNARIAELEAEPAATHTEGRTDGDAPESKDKPWANNPIYLKARKAAGLE